MLFQRMHNNQWTTLSRKSELEECTDTQPSTDGQKGTFCTPLKQAKLQPGGPHTSQSRVNHLVFGFVIEDVQPFSLVEVPSFCKLLEVISGGRKVLCRNHLMQRIEREFESTKEAPSTKLQTVKSVCTTADIWSAHNRSFIVMT